jgi:pilus assembly protein Flp/PilA
MRPNTFATRFCRDESGQDLIEYGLLAALISIAAITSILALGQALDARYVYIAGEIPPGS